jgi:hypothetical protein
MALILVNMQTVVTTETSIPGTRYSAIVSLYRVEQVWRASEGCYPRREVVTVTVTTVDIG